MADIVPADVRSRMMRGIRGADTKPELLIRKGLHANGFRYRLHVRSLPGSPDIVLPRFRAAIFVHGCFWHGHDCHLFRWPSTHENFWREKIGRNRIVDTLAGVALSEAGWRCGIIWECALKGRTRLQLETVIRHCADWLRGDEDILEMKGI